MKHHCSSALARFAVLSLLIAAAQPLLAQGPARAERVRIDVSASSNREQSRLLLESYGGTRIGGAILIDVDQTERALSDWREQGLLNPEIAFAELLSAPFGPMQIQRIMDPVAAAKELRLYEQSPRLRAIADRLAAAEYADCSQPAAKYDAAAQGNRSDLRQALGPAVDQHCLHSFFRWRRADGAYASDPVPPLLESNAGHALQALVVLERLTARGEREYICGGLLLPGNRVRTAAHCFGESPANIDALAHGRIFVRSVAAPEQPGWPVRSLVREFWESTKQVRNDYVDLAFDASTQIPAPATQFVGLADNSDPLVMGYFQDFDRGRALEAPQGLAPIWYLGMRWARPGLCHAINAADHCVRLLCQTINGFSGMPIFDQAGAVPGQPLRVLGLVSRPDHPEARCGNFLNLSTLAYTDVAAAAPIAAATELNHPQLPTRWPSTEP